MTSLDKYKGYLNMALDFDNQFNKEILYIILNYKYVDKYDTEYFNESVKIMDKVANFFKGETEVTTSEEYNDIAEFLYTKVPGQAYIGTGDKKVERDFLMDGLQVSVLRVVFTDKTELLYEDLE